MKFKNTLSIILSAIILMGLTMGGSRSASSQIADGDFVEQSRIISKFGDYIPMSLRISEKDLEKAANAECAESRVIAPNRMMRGDESFAGRAILKNRKNKNSLFFNPDDLPGLEVGYSYYEFQTNGAMPERLAYWGGEGAPLTQMFWMVDEMGDASWSGRGTYYELIDYSDPNDVYTFDLWFEGRLEGDTRTGWPQIVQHDDGRVSTLSHDPAPDGGQVLFMQNSEFAGYEFSVQQMNPSRALWPRMAIDGQGNLHAIYTYDSAAAARAGDDDLLAQIYYRRSTNGGQSWEPQLQITGAGAFDGAATDGRGGDTYVIKAKGDNVAIAWVDREFNMFYRKSVDAGETWSQPTRIYNGENQTYYILEELGGNQVRFNTDTAFVCGTNMDIIFDSQDRLHFVAGVIGKNVHGIGEKIGDTEIRRIDQDTTTQFYYFTIGFMHQYENSGRAWIFFGNPQGDGSAGRTEFGEQRRINNRYGWGFGFTPQLGIDSEDNLYCVYSGVVLNDFRSVMTDTDGDGIPDNALGLMGHVYITHVKPGPNYGWSQPKNLTPNGADAQWTTMADDVVEYLDTKWMFIGYMADEYPGDAVTNTDLPISESYIYAYACPTDSLNESLISVEEQVEVPTGDVTLNVAPNPVKDYANVYLFNEGTPRDAKVELFDVYGAKVAVLFEGALPSGTKFLSVDVAELSAGAYYLTATVDGRRITKLTTVLK